MLTSIQSCRRYVLLIVSRSVVRMAKSTSNSNKDERPANERRRISEDKDATNKSKGMDVSDYARHENSNDSAFNDLAFSPESSLKPEKLLEGIQDFPSLYSWDRVATGMTLTLPALMKIGLIYSFVWTFKKIDTGLRNLMVINLIYGIFTDLVMAVLNMSVNVGQTMLFVFNLSVDLIPIKSVRHIINALQRGTVRSAKYADSYLAFRIKDYLLNNPRLQETFTELMDDLLHDVVKSSCSKAHPNSNLSRGEQIEKAYDGLNKKSFEVETN